MRRLVAIHKSSQAIDLEAPEWAWGYNGDEIGSDEEGGWEAGKAGKPTEDFKWKKAVTQNAGM